MIPSIIDFQPENLYRAHEELVRNLVPPRWLKYFVAKDIANWAHLFAVGGMAEYDESLALELGKGPSRGPCVGTFMAVGTHEYFAGSDERGVWTYCLDPYDLHFARKLLAQFLRTCSGPVDARAIQWHGRMSNLVELIQTHATGPHAFRALLSLGRLYIPNVKESLRATY